MQRCLMVRAECAKNTGKIKDKEKTAVNCEYRLYYIFEIPCYIIN